MLDDRLISRREALQHLSAGTLLALGLWPGALPAGEKNTGPFRFLVINDTHYQSSECGRWLEGVIRQVKAGPPIEFCLHAGDLTDNGRASDLAAVKDIFKTLGVPTYFVIGNHDYLNEKLAAAEPKPTPPLHSPRDQRPLTQVAPRPQFDRRAYERFFPRQLNYYFEHRGWQILGLDTSMGTLFEKTSIQSATLRWVDDRLPKLDKKRPLIILTHFPLGADVRYRPLNADALLDRFREHNLQSVFCGHFHGFTERHAGAVTLTTNKCCALSRTNHDGTKEKGYFLCTAVDGRISRAFVEFKG
jgi:3',5'-cyclic AMP phosphodiesterase CpdA